MIFMFLPTRSCCLLLFTLTLIALLFFFEKECLALRAFLSIRKPLDSLCVQPLALCVTIKTFRVVSSPVSLSSVANNVLTAHKYNILSFIKSCHARHVDGIHGKHQCRGSASTCSHGSYPISGKPQTTIDALTAHAVKNSFFQPKDPLYFTKVLTMKYVILRSRRLNSIRDSTLINANTGVEGEICESFSKKNSEVEKPLQLEKNFEEMSMHSFQNSEANKKTAVPFPRLGMFPNLVEALGNFGVKHATEIQQLCIPAILGGENSVLGAETGSGKTLGYILGVIQNIMVQKMIHERKEDMAMIEKENLPIPRHYPYAVIMVPSRELASQIVTWARRLCRKTTITTQLMLGSYTRWPFGTLSFPVSPDIIVCTPQVLASFASRGIAKQKALFEHVQMLVIDEADMLVDGGFRGFLRSIFTEFRNADRKLAASCKRQTQYIFAAATIPEKGHLSVRNTIVSLCPKATFFCTRNLHHSRKELEQEYVEIASNSAFEEKVAMLLERLQKLSSHDKVIIFANTAHTAKQLCESLEKKMSPGANPKLFSSELDQKDRAFNLGLFSRGKSKILVCTDAASRGLDINGTTVVIQFDFALSAVTHLHRIGRVARAGKGGKAINFFDASNKLLVDAIRQAEECPTTNPLSDAFSRKRSFRKKAQKIAAKSLSVVVDFPSKELG